MMKPPVDRVLAASEWFQSIDAGLQAQLWAAARFRRLKEGAALYRQGDAPDGLYMTVEGSVRLTSYSAQGSHLLMLVARPGEWFGEVSTLDGRPRQQEAIASGDGLVLHLDGSDIERIGIDAPSLWRAVGTLASLHQREALRHIANVLSLPIAERIAALLDTLHRRQPGTPLPITQDEIAASVGCSRQTVNGILRRFQRRKLVAIGYRSLTVIGNLITESVDDGG